MNSRKDKITGIARLALVLLASFVLVSCGGGSGGGASNTGATLGDGIEAILTGGNNVSSDSNIVFVPFSDTNTTQTTPATIQAGLATTQAGLIVVPGTLPQETLVKWVSQHTANCDDSTKNAYCGFASVLMGATYLNASKLPIPVEYGHSTIVGDWIRTSVNNAFSSKTIYQNCGGGGIYPADIPNFATALGIEGEEFTLGSENDDVTIKWIADALATGYPVVARVPYQEQTCSGMMIATGKSTQAEAEKAYYQGGAPTIIRDMVSSGIVQVAERDAQGKKTGNMIDRNCAIQPTGHWVLISEVNQNSVKVYDPDPLAADLLAGVRRYSISSFLQGLKVRGFVGMFKLMPGGSSKQTYAFALPNKSIELGTNQIYSANNTTPVVLPLIANAAFTATGLPDGLSMDTEGRIVGSSVIAGTYSVQVTMISTVNSATRYAPRSMTVVVKAKTSIIEALQFVTPSSLNRAAVGNTYLQPLGITGTAEAPTFSLISGNLPQGLNLQNGQIVGTPTQSGEYSIDIQVSTPTSNLTKTFTLVVDPAPASAVPAPQPVLSGINPASVTGMDGQQTVVFMGSGFADGARVELTDTTNGGTYSKVPVSINSAGTEITIRANFTSSPAIWSARIIPLTGNPSATITFPVVAPASAGPVISSVSPSVLTASPTAQTITLTGTNYRAGAVVEITNLATGVRASVQPAALTGIQLTVSYSFTTASMWGVRVINSDGTSSASTDILVNAPTSTVAPAMPTLVSPGTATGPGIVLPNTTASLSWSGNASASYYAVAVRDLSSGVLVVDATTVSPSYSLNLLEGKQYRWNAAACNAAGCSSFAAPLYFQSPQPTVTVPTPAISSLSITSVPADSTARSLTIYGSSFAAGNVVKYRWLNPAGGSTASATVSSASQISTTFNPGSVADTIYVKVCQSASSSVCSGELPISVTGTGSTGSPDLVPQSISFPTSITAGNSLTINWTMANQGTADAATSNSAVRITTSSTSSAGTTLASVSTGTIAAGSSVSQSATVTVPSTAGTYYVWIIADNNTALTQSNVANDIVKAVSSLTVNAVVTGSPDLVPQSISFLTSVTAGNSLTINWTMSNQGTASAATSNSAVRITTSSASSAGTTYASILTGTIAAGTSVSQSATVTVPSTAGTYYVWIIADNNSALTQNNVANDIVKAASSLTVNAVVTGSPDLVPQSISFPTSVTAGNSLTINWTMSNQGTASAATSNSAVRITTSSTSAAGTTLASVATGTIAAGSSVSQSATVTVPSTAGTYYVWIIADNNTALTQSNAANDIAKATSSLTVNPVVTGSPDLVPQSISFPTSVTAGNSLTINWTMANQGTASAATSNTAVRITTSSTSAAGTTLASVATGTIVAGSSVSQSATVTVPSTAGTYYVWIIADNNTALTQSNVANDIVKAASSLTVSAAITPLVVNGFLSSYSSTVMPYKPTISLSGSGFNSVTQISLSCTMPNGTVCGGSPYVWTSANWSGKYSVSSDTVASISPTLLVSIDPAGTYSWSATFSGGGQTVTKYFTVTK